MNLTVKLRQDTITGDLRRLTHQFSPGEMSQTMAEVGREFVTISKEAFGAGRPNRPDYWPALSPNYQKRIGYFGPPTLIRTGFLKESIQIGYVQPTSVTVESEVPYAAVHQFGGGNNIPARPYFPVQTNGASGEYELTPYAAERIRKILEMRFR